MKILTDFFDAFLDSTHFAILAKMAMATIRRNHLDVN